MSFFSSDSYPGDGCDTAAGHRSLKDAATHMNLAPLSEDDMDSLLDSHIPMSYMATVSRLMFQSRNHGYEEGHAIGYEKGLDDGAQKVKDDPEGYFHPGVDRA
jgi:hypothetical protein